MNSIPSDSSAGIIGMEAMKVKGIVEVNIVLYYSSRSSRRRRTLNKKEERKGNQGKGTKVPGK